MTLPPARFNRPDHPLRPPAWRWLRAVNFVDNGWKPTPEKDDAWLRKAERFYRALRLSPDNVAQEKLRRRMPAVFAAHALYSGQPCFKKWEVEARLLTDEAFAVIAAKTGLSAAEVAAYHALFFHVRDRRQFSSYIQNMAIAPKGWWNLTEHDTDVILKMYAYAGGPFLLDALVDYFHNPPVVPERPEELSPDDLQKLRIKLLFRASILTRVLPIDEMVFDKLAIIADAVEAISRGFAPATPAALGIEPNKELFERSRRDPPQASNAPADTPAKDADFKAGSSTAEVA